MDTISNINLEMIPWAIIRAGFDFHDFVKDYPKIEDWLNQKKEPTFKQLENFSNKVHIPFGYLFLSEPPREDIPIPFFRSGYGKFDMVSLNLYDTILLIQRRQDWLRDHLLENETIRLKFVGNQRGNAVEMIVDDIRQTLQIEKDWARTHRTWEDALDHISYLIEGIGIIITFSSIVGNNPHRSIAPEECRGFVLVDEYAPFMFINNADTKAAQMFSIAHELAHIWIGESAGFDFRMMLPADDPTEILCDKVAAELLVPQDTFLHHWYKNPKKYKTLSRIFKVSPIVVARRALDLEQIGRRQFFDFYNGYLEEFRRIQREKSPGGDFYKTTKKRLNLSFVAHIDSAVKQNKLLYRDACKLTGLNSNTYDKFIKTYL